MSTTPSEHRAIRELIAQAPTVLVCMEIQWRTVEIPLQEVLQAYAFDALLVVAKESYDHRDHACVKPHRALDDAIAALDAEHPGWREWTDADPRP